MIITVIKIITACIPRAPTSNYTASSICVYSNSAHVPSSSSTSSNSCSSSSCFISTMHTTETLIVHTNTHKIMHPQGTHISSHKNYTSFSLILLFLFCSCSENTNEFESFTIRIPFLLFFSRFTACRNEGY